VLQVQADARPRAEPAAHRIHEYVDGLQVRGGVGMTRSPSFQAGERIFLPLRARDLDQRVLRNPPA
jgi:hypothetical protein